MYLKEIKSHGFKSFADDISIELCDGIILPGGEKTFEYDTYVVNYCIKNDIPILGICLGMQIMASTGKKRENGLPALDNEKNLTATYKIN